MSGTTPEQFGSHHERLYLGVEPRTAGNRQSLGLHRYRHLGKDRDGAKRRPVAQEPGGGCVEVMGMGTNWPYRVSGLEREEWTGGDCSEGASLNLSNRNKAGKGCL